MGRAVLSRPALSGAMGGYPREERLGQLPATVCAGAARDYKRCLPPPAGRLTPRRPIAASMQGAVRARKVLQPVALQPEHRQRPTARGLPPNLPVPSSGAASCRPSQPSLTTFQRFGVSSTGSRCKPRTASPCERESKPVPRYTVVSFAPPRGVRCAAVLLCPPAIPIPARSAVLGAFDGWALSGCPTP